MRIVILFLLLPLISFSQGNASSSSVYSNDRMLEKVNRLRSKGCYCGKRYMKPVRPLQWNKTLYKSAYSHARDMSRNNYFSHVSRLGKNIGYRASHFGYEWEIIGENIGEGQSDFNEVYLDWKKSREHCEMMMHPKIMHMAIASYKDKWVQHFGKLRRINKYSRQ